MSQTNEIYGWLINSLFIFGVMLVPLGLFFLLVPEKALSITAKLNRWISTEHIFDALNQPRFQERLIYRHHRLFGVLVLVFTAISIYMMVFYTDQEILLQNILLLVDSSFGKWLLESLFYIIVIANILAFFIGAVIFIRPSLLKKLESKANQWVDTDKNLKFLDSTRELPESVFIKHPRIFGVIIIAGGLYMVMNIGKFITY